MKIGSIQELELTAKLYPDVMNILMDFNVGRQKVTQALNDFYDFQISEHLVRSFRDRASQGFASMIEDKIHAVSSKTITDKESIKAKRVIAFGDFQINKHDPEFLAKAVQFVKDQQPDMICLTGDESDNSAVGRWAKGMKEEFESNLQDQIDETIMWLRAIREAAPNAEINMADSNHMHWITRAVETRLPGLATLRYLTPEVMYELDDMEITYHRKLYEFLPDYILGHGHQWELTSKSHITKGPEHVTRTGKSILAGHVHQAALRPVFIGYEGKGTQQVYVNAGCMMDFEKAMESNGGYIKGTSPNWAKGIVVITRECGQNYTELLLGQNNGTFRYEGKIY